MSNMRQHTVSCRILKTCIVWTLRKTFPLGDMALFACHDDQPEEVRSAVYHFT